MKFGMESEKIIYDLKDKKVSNCAQRTLQALEDYKLRFGLEEASRVTGEFVHNMLEMASSPHEDILEVAKDYLVSYQLVRDACARTQKTVLPLGSFPVFFQPTMVSQWKYYVKNAILSQSADTGWTLEQDHALFSASNCAAAHIHSEVETLPEFLTFSRELMDKHNLAVSLTPFGAFSSSPYFESKHDAKSMRALRYYFGTYREFPQFGGIPPLVRSSAELLGFYQDSMRDWENRASKLGFNAEEMHRLTLKDAFFWGVVRWNRKWNTIEMRFLDSDLVGMDLAKFAVLSSAMKRADIKGEHLHTRLIPIREDQVSERDTAGLDRMLAERMPEALAVSGSEVAILPTILLKRLVHLSVLEGLSNRLVHAYVGKIFDFARKNLGPTEQWMAAPVLQAYEDGITTSDRILKLANRKKTLRKEDADEIIEEILITENVQFERLKGALPLEWRLFSPTLDDGAPLIETPILKRTAGPKLPNGRLDAH
jgi:hypothetical protein